MSAAISPLDGSGCGIVIQDRCGIVGNAQHATATTQHGMRPSNPLVVSPTLSTRVPETGLKIALDRDAMMMNRETTSIKWL